MRDVASIEPIREPVFLFIDRLNRHRVGIVENQLTGLAGRIWKGKSCSSRWRIGLRLRGSLIFLSGVR